MAKYILKYWFEHGGFCIWSVNGKAIKKFGYTIKNENLPISCDLIANLYSLENEYRTYLDWDYPPNPSPWSKQHKIDFKKRAIDVLRKLQVELGCDYELINDIDSCIDD